MRLWYFSALPLAGLALAATQQREVVLHADEEFKGQTGSVKFIGACRATETTIACWDAQGKVNSELSKWMLAQYKQGYPRFDISYGRKNRLLIFEGPISYEAEGRFDFDDYGDRRTSDPRSKREFILLQQKVPIDQVATDVLGGEWRPLPPSARFPVAEGRIASFAGVTYRIAKIGPREVPREENQPPTWTLIVKYSGSAESNTRHEWNVIGASGTVIRTVDLNGNPVIAPTTSGRMGGTEPPEPKFVDAMFGQANAGDGEIYLSTNIDPSKIRSCFLSGGRKVIVRFTGIPLEPK